MSTRLLPFALAFFLPSAALPSAALPAAAAENAEAYWSPDGRELIFQSARPPYACDQILLASAASAAPPPDLVEEARQIEQFPATWRALRLVVDTGLHVKGWTRQQAIDYCKANSARTEHDIEVEIDRYIVWPGGAVCYKIGELKLKELRAYAQRELGPRFDIRAFHDRLLAHGQLPLALLEKSVKAWVAERKAAAGNLSMSAP